MSVPKLPDPTKPSTRRIDIKPTTAARNPSAIADPTKTSTSAHSQPDEDEARRASKEKEEA